MKLKFKHQPFQSAAAAAACDVFAGQPKIARQEYIKDVGEQPLNPMGEQLSMDGVLPMQPIVSIGFTNAHIHLSDKEILTNIQRIQRNNAIRPDDKLHGKYNITVEMETAQPLTRFSGACARSPTGTRQVKPIHTSRPCMS